MDPEFYGLSSWGASPVRTALEQRERIACDFFLAHASLEAKTALLDFGCGDGCFLAALQEQAPDWHLTGVDGSTAQLKKAEARLQNVDLRVAHFDESLPFGEAQFDFVFSGEILEHLVNPDAYLSEARRVLRPNGYLILTTPNLMAWYNRILIPLGISPIFAEYSARDASIGYGPLKRFKSSGSPVGHLRLFHPAAIRDLLHSAGFDNIRLQAARFEYFPPAVRVVDRWISGTWTKGGSNLIAFAKRSADE